MVDGGNVTYTATGYAGSGLSFNQTTGEFYAMPDMATAGTYYGIIITARDDSAECVSPFLMYCEVDSDPFNIEITSAAGGNPTWTSMVPSMDTSLDQIVDDSINISLSVTTDPEGNNVTYTASSLPPGLSLSGSSIIGTLRNAGTYTVDLTATDDTNSNSVTAQVTFNVDPVDSTVVYYVDETPAAGRLKALGFTSGEYIDYIFRANINSSATNIRYNLLANLGNVPGRNPGDPGDDLPINTLPQWLNWNTYYNASERYAQITGNAPSQDIAYDYNFTVRAYDFTTFDPGTLDTDTYNDRDYELNVLADATCVSPVNNKC